VQHAQFHRLDSLEYTCVQVQVHHQSTLALLLLVLLVLYDLLTVFVVDTATAIANRSPDTFHVCLMLSSIAIVAEH